jgi:deoxyribodipyrimidine photo-lyase
VKKEAPPPVITKNVLMWFRNDLRLLDNKALYAASLRAKIGDKKNLVGLFIISESEWEGHDEAPVKIDFWMRNLAVLKESLGKLNIPLIVKKAASGIDVAKIVESLVKELDISHVFWNTEYMVDENQRDANVRNALARVSGVYVEEFDDLCVIPPKEIKIKVGILSCRHYRAPFTSTAIRFNVTDTSVLIVLDWRRIYRLQILPHSLVQHCGNQPALH